MTRWMILGAILSGGVVLASCNTTPSPWAGFPRSDFFHGLDGLGGSDDRQAFLQQRLEPRYRVGRPEAGLADFLRSQGFQVERSEASGAQGTPIYGFARAVGPWMITCRQVASVLWRADPQGVIRELHVSYGDTGCF